MENSPGSTSSNPIDSYDPKDCDHTDRKKKKKNKGKKGKKTEEKTLGVAPSTKFFPFIPMCHQHDFRQIANLQSCIMQGTIPSVVQIETPARDAPTPGPSTPNPHDRDCDIADPKKKKRTRRSPRKKLKKPENNASDSTLEEELVPFTPNFVIRPLKEQLGVVYKQRDKSFGRINLKSFIQNSTIPYVFQTGTSGCDPAASLSISRKIEKWNINGVCVPSSSKTPSGSRLAQKQANAPLSRTEKKKRKKNLVLFNKYLTEEEVLEGLQKGDLMKGTIRINPKNFKESYVGNEDVSKSDYIIGTVLDRNGALEGDEVVLRLKTVNEEKKKLMEVVYITKRVHPRTAVGFLKPIEKSREFALFTPRDRRIPMMKIPKISWPSGFQSHPDLYSDILFLAKISDWREVKQAVGLITENLGLNGDLKVESLAILREFCLDPTPYSDNIKEFLPKTCEIPREEFQYREDLRRECIFTIDPLTARDLDDAVSCRELENGNFQVGVHISDASFYLKENTRLDEQVKEKATTIYMVDSVYHMLPVELCLLCSLLPGQDKLGFSIIWELTPSGEIVNQRITRSVINSCVQLAYEHAQMMIDEPDKIFETDDLPEIHNGFTPLDLTKIVNDLQKIAVCLREKRRMNGSLKIDQVKISFSLDPSTGEPQEFWIYENKPAHRLIEEFMLLANMCVAKFINEAFPDLAFLRLHEPPKPTMMTVLQKNLETIGMHIDISSSGGIQSSLNKYVTHDFLGQSRMIVLNHLFAKPMKRARYVCAGALDDDISYTHFALSIPIYTHFTSPIRRYADIMVHRLLAASLNYQDKPEWQPVEVAVIAETCNRQKYHAKRAGEASSDMYLAHYIEKNQPYIQDAVVVDAKERSIDVIVLNTGTVVRIYMSDFGEKATWKSEEIKVQTDSSDENNSKKMWKIYVKFPQTDADPEVFMVLEIFTLVRVELSRKPKTNKLEAKLLRPIQQLSLL